MSSITMNNITTGGDNLLQMDPKFLTGPRHDSVYNYDEPGMESLDAIHEGQDKRFKNTLDILRTIYCRDKKRPCKRHRNKQAHLHHFNYSIVETPSGSLNVAGEK